MAKTEEEIIQTAINSWKKKDTSNEFWFKSMIQGAWRSGYTNAQQQDAEILEAIKNEGYANGLKDGEKAAEADKTIAYKQGLEDAWLAAAKIFCYFPEEDMCKLFGYELDETLFENIHPQEAIDKLAQYRSMKAEEAEIHLGDEVEAWDTNAWVKFIAVGDNGDGTITGFNLNGGAYEYPKSSCRKTGKKWKVVEE